MKSEEKMWNNLFRKAKQKNAVVVLSAGNDKVLSKN